ncbi:MAG: flagellar motor switch protein FliM [Eubacterium sp.]|jgi:flagellar motor switch protein FliM|nr:flagellar motor switch protein FliM [Eubacterium sp.]MCI9410457.1 flagellar motor switch protein FliM [Eubacterium sp.]MCI9536820.1 flagellar motor switch protein FliM [Eubacterium sp.]
MGDVLSQSEIDNLLSALNNGEFDSAELDEVEERQVKDYNFARPSKFSKDHLRTLVFIFEHYARLLSTNLPVYLRKNVQVEVMHAEAATYQEFSNSLSNPVLLGVVNFMPLEGNIIIEMASGLGYTIVDRMLGGSGVPLEKAREFTEIELTIIERIMVVCTNLLVEPWHNVQVLEPMLERIETNSQFAQFVSPNEMTSIVTMNIRIGDVEGLFNICIPYAVVEPVIEKINTKYWYSTAEVRDEDVYREIIENSLNRAQIPVRAIMGKSAISVNDFMHLQVGDIIKVDTKIEDELDVYVGNIKKFSALPGAYDDAYAVKIKKVYREE